MGNQPKRREVSAGAEEGIHLQCGRKVLIQNLSFIWANVAGGKGMTEEMLLLKRDSFICFHCVPCQCMKDTEKLFVT